MRKKYGTGLYKKGRLWCIEAYLKQNGEKENTMADVRRGHKPKLRNSQVYKEIAKRLGLKSEVVKQVVETYGDVIFTCLINKIEVEFGSLGTFTFRVRPPTDYSEWRSFDIDGEPGIFYQYNMDGYLKPGWRFGKRFSRDIREQTCIPYGSIPSEGGYVVANSEGERRVDYLEWAKARASKVVENGEDIIEQEQDEYEDWFNVEQE